MKPRNPDNEHAVILFDGVCNLCNAFVLFVIRHDPQGIFTFAPLQGRYGNELRAKYHINTEALNTVILLQNGKIYTRSTAALRISKQLKWPCNLWYGFIIVPRFLRDAVYKFISRNRYKWFGKKEACMVATPELSARFLN